jgi:hypothetical protein
VADAGLAVAAAAAAGGAGGLSAVAVAGLTAAAAFCAGGGVLLVCVRKERCDVKLIVSEYCAEEHAPVGK